mgnify:CR=1 FL=1
MIHLLDFATGGLKPDLTLLLDVDVEEGLRRKRSSQEWNRLDAEEVAFYHKVRQGYLSMAAAEPQRWVVIDAGQPRPQVQQAMRASPEFRLLREAGDWQLFEMTGHDGRHVFIPAIEPRAVDRSDLMTVVLHELGHIAGLDDLDASLGDLMSRELSAGVRRSVSNASVDLIMASTV